jgi:hypothetical protein
MTGAETLEMLSLAGPSFIASARQSRRYRMQVLRITSRSQGSTSSVTGKRLCCCRSNLRWLLIAANNNSHKQAVCEDVRGIESYDQYSGTVLVNLGTWYPAAMVSSDKAVKLGTSC